MRGRSLPASADDGAQDWTAEREPCFAAGGNELDLAIEAAEPSFICSLAGSEYLGRTVGENDGNTLEDRGAGELLRTGVNERLRDVRS